MADERDIKAAFDRFMDALDIPRSEFYPGFVIDMCKYMAISYHKYGLVAKAYPAQFDALADVRARIAKYRETGEFNYLVDAANFCMIECMHPRKEGACWGRNDDDNSPGRTDAVTRRMQQIDNQGNRLGGDGFLHIKSGD